MRFETKLLAAGAVARVVLMLTLLGLVTACGKGEEKASQSIVRVNSDEITVLQLNNELQRANVQAGQQDEAGRQIVKALVDRQILAQAAHKDKLDRNPRVMQAIESAKTQILAQAYLENKLANLPKPTGPEVDAYRSAHTDIFANRKVYIMDELAFAPEGKDIQAVSGSAKTLDDVIHWLDANQIKHARAQASHASETLPPELLAKFGKMVDGDIIFINANGHTVAGRMLEIKDQPISEKDSIPLIERILQEQKRKLAAEDEMTRLRTAAKINYINKKFDPASDNKVPAPAAKVEPAKPAEGAKPAGNAKPADPAVNHMEKGLSGL